MDAHTFTKEAKKFKQMLSACQKADGNCLLGQERSANSGIHATRNHNNVRSELRNTKKTAKGHLEKKKAWNADIWCSVPVLQCVSA
jgi:phage gp29-like protein